MFAVSVQVSGTATNLYLVSPEYEIKSILYYRDFVRNRLTREIMTFHEDEVIYLVVILL